MTECPAWFATSRTDHAVVPGRWTGTETLQVEMMPT
jgi:hypothetical protein